MGKTVLILINNQTASKNLIKHCHNEVDLVSVRISYNGAIASTVKNRYVIP